MHGDPRPGPPATEHRALLEWFEGEAAGGRLLLSLRFLPPSAPLHPWGEVRLGRDPSGLALRPDDGALGHSLAGRLQGIFDDGRLHHDLWVEARWGLLVPMPPGSVSSVWPVAVLHVLDSEPGLDPCRPWLIA